MRKRPTSHINITPLVDVLLILLVILMLVAPLAVKRLPVELPRTELAGTPVLVKALQLTVSADGNLSVDGTPVTTPELRQRIRPDTSVELYIDKSVTYERLAQVANEVQAAGPKEVVLVSR